MMHDVDPTVIAHRGASGDAPENTLAAIALAVRQGADRVEVDVHATRDGEVVVHHDADLLRTAGDPRSIGSLTLAELRGVRVYCSAARSAGEPIPTLAEALAAALPLPLAIEIKTPAFDALALARAVAAAIERGPTPESSAVISFDRTVVRSLLRLLPPQRVGLIRNREYGVESWRDALDLRAGIAVLSRKIARAAAVEALRSAGKDVWVYSLDEADAVLAFAAAGVTGVISNFPAVARAALTRRRGAAPPA